MIYRIMLSVVIFVISTACWVWADDLAAARAAVREALPPGANISDAELDKIIRESGEKALRDIFYKEIVNYLHEQPQYLKNLEVYKKWINDKVIIDHDDVLKAFNYARQTEHSDIVSGFEHYILDGLVTSAFKFLKEEVAVKNPGINPLEALNLIAEREVKKDNIKTNYSLGYLIVTKLTINSFAERLTKMQLPYHLKHQATWPISDKKIMFVCNTLERRKGSQGEIKAQGYTCVTPPAVDGVEYGITASSGSSEITWTPDRPPVISSVKAPINFTVLQQYAGKLKNKVVSASANVESLPGLFSFLLSTGAYTGPDDVLRDVVVKASENDYKSIYAMYDAYIKYITEDPAAARQEEPSAKPVKKGKKSAKNK